MVSIDFSLLMAIFTPLPFHDLSTKINFQTHFQYVLRESCRYNTKLSRAFQERRAQKVANVLLILGNFGSGSSERAILTKQPPIRKACEPRRSNSVRVRIREGSCCELLKVNRSIAQNRFSSQLAKLAATKKLRAIPWKLTSFHAMSEHGALQLGFCA